MSREVRKEVYLLLWACFCKVMDMRIKATKTTLFVLYDQSNYFHDQISCQFCIIHRVINYLAYTILNYNLS